MQLLMSDFRCQLMSRSILSLRLGWSVVVSRRFVARISILASWLRIGFGTRGLLSGVHPFWSSFNEVAPDASFSIFRFSSFNCERNSSIRSPRPSPWFRRFSRTCMASRASSETLRAPVTVQSCRRARNSSSESRMLIVRDRGFRTVMPNSSRGLTCRPVPVPLIDLRAGSSNEDKKIAAANSVSLAESRFGG